MRKAPQNALLGCKRPCARCRPITPHTPTSAQSWPGGIANSCKLIQSIIAG